MKRARAVVARGCCAAQALITSTAEPDGAGQESCCWENTGSTWDAGSAPARCHPPLPPPLRVVMPVLGSSRPSFEFLLLSVLLCCLVVLLGIRYALLLVGLSLLSAVVVDVLRCPAEQELLQLHQAWTQRWRWTPCGVRRPKALAAGWRHSVAMWWRSLPFLGLPWRWWSLTR